MRKHRVIGGALLAAALLVAGTARADKAEAKKLFKQAEIHFAAGQYQSALEHYQKAYQEMPLAGFHLNIGQCYRKLGNCERAISHYKQYLKLSKNPKFHADAKRLIKVCEEQLASQKPKEPAAPPVVDDTPPPEAPPTAVPPPTPKDEGEREGLSPIYFWSGVGVSAALLLTGTITGAMALSKSSKFKDLSTPAADLQDLKDSGETLRTTSSVTFGIGAAAAVATTVIFFLTDFGSKEKEKETTTTVSAAPIQGGGLMSIGGRF